MKSIKYSIIVIVDDTNNLEHCLNSIKVQTYDLSKIEVILVDNSSDKIPDSIVSTYSKFFKINCFTVDDSSCDKLYLEVINQAKGETITFISSNNYYANKKTLRKLDSITSTNGLVAIKSCYYDNDNNVLVNYKIQPHKTGYINLEDNPFMLALNLNAYFISKKMLTNIEIENNHLENAKIVLLINLLSKKKNYYYNASLAIISYSPFETNSSKYSIQYNKWWYTESIEYFINYCKTLKDIPTYIQEILLYVIYTRINCNIYDRNKGVLTKQEAEIFFDKVVLLTEFIDNSIILRYERDTKENFKYLFKLPRWIRYYIVDRKLKNRKSISYSNNKINLEYMYKNKKEVIYNNDTVYERVNVYAINYDNGKLTFDCTTSLKDYLNDDDFVIYAKYNGKKIPTTRSYFYPLLKAFGKTLQQKYCFNFTIDPEVKGELKVFALINGEEVPLCFNYSKVQAHLSNSKRSFWHYKNFVLYNKVNRIIIKKAKTFDLLKAEVLFDLSKIKNVKNKYRALKLVTLRMLYYITKPFYKNKHVWLTWDKLYKAGDNGEYMYQYCLKQNRNIYYFIKKDSPDFKRLRKQNKKRCVVFNSLKAKLLSLHSEVILDTHVNVISYCGFDGISRHFVSGFFNPNIICIQHGLTIQKIAQYQNRLFDNIKYYCCASQFEIENIKSPLYDYREDQMSLTGLARYDGLKSKAEKLILITPTWRRNVVNSSIAYVKKKHNDNFKRSDYFNIYNSLINNDKLINCAKEYGYKLVYLLHPAMSGQLEDFVGNDYVSIIPATGNINYEDILTRASLMVTDYSGVQFDFAYQRKVLVYYHPSALPPHYDAGGLDYTTMGFGPICENEEQIVNELCENMKNGCVIKDLYKKRADDFFAFDDFNNCERILKTVDAYLEKIDACNDNHEK